VKALPQHNSGPDVVHWIEHPSFELGIGSAGNSGGVEGAEPPHLTQSFLIAQVRLTKSSAAHSSEVEHEVFWRSIGGDAR
jgi:hypothetical protein